MRGFFILCLILLTGAPPPASAEAGVAEYNFDIEYKWVTKAGKAVRAMAVGGSIPAPVVEAREGDILRVTFNNKMDVETSIHWHGVLLPADQDGVPGLNTRPIAPGASFTFEFPVIQSGTYWYHSHTGLQEQRGIYGPIVFHPKQDAARYDREYVVVFSDWINEGPDRAMHNLKRDGDYYALKKGSVQSWDRVMAAGSDAVRRRLSQAWSRMGPMDISDVGYDAFLANGEQETRLGAAEPGERVLLRMVNAATSSYFDVEFAGGPMRIIAADGIPVKETAVQRLRMAVAETYDVVVTLPQSPALAAYELRASATDGTGYSSAILGTGTTVPARDIPRPNLLGMDMAGMDMSDAKMDMGGMKMGPTSDVIAHMTDYAPLEAPASTAYAANLPTRKIELALTGNMERYVWSFGNKTLRESDRILIRKGEVVRFQLVNRTMMSHPLHLHGHFFRVLNGKGDLSPLKHTVDVPPMGEVTIEFLANEERDWFFHCHMLYHMKAGMARVVSYESTSQADRPLIQRVAGPDHMYLFGDLAALSNMGYGRVWATNSRNMVEVEYDFDWDDKYEVQARYSRNLSRFLEVYGGIKLEKETFNEENVGIFGVRYVLPLLIEADLRIETNGDIVLGLASELQLTSRLKFTWMADTDEEYRTGLEYEVSKRFSVIASHDSDFDLGAGLMVKF